MQKNLRIPLLSHFENQKSIRNFIKQNPDSLANHQDSLMFIFRISIHIPLDLSSVSLLYK